MPIPQKGPQMAAFLAQFFKLDTSQRPEFDLGFSALRRSELDLLARMAGVGLPPRPANKRHTIIPLMNAALAEGKFDKLIKQQPADPKDALIADLTRRLDALENTRPALPKLHKLNKRGPGSERKDLIRRALDLGFGGQAATAKTDALRAFVAAKEGLKEAPAETAFK